MSVNPKHAVFNYVEIKDYCSRKNFDDKVRSTFCGYKRRELESVNLLKILHQENIILHFTKRDKINTTIYFIVYNNVLNF